MDRRQALVVALAAVPISVLVAVIELATFAVVRIRTRGPRTARRWAVKDYLYPAEWFVAVEVARRVRTRSFVDWLGFNAA